MQNLYLLSPNSRYCGYRMVLQKVPWLTVSGYGAHIKSTPTQLIIQRKGEIQNHPLRSVHHLVIAGGHTIHTSAIINLLKAGGAISFLDQDSNPVGFLHPPLRHPDEEVKAIQKLAPAPVHPRYRHRCYPGPDPPAREARGGLGRGDPVQRRTGVPPHLV